MRVGMILIATVANAPGASAQMPDAPQPMISAVRSAAPSSPGVPPPIFAMTPPADRRVAPVTAIAIRMTLGNQILWSGPLNIGGTSSARISLSEPVSGAADCERSGSGRPTRQIELSINGQSYRPSTMPEYRLSARYPRPSEGGDCLSGTRSIAIEQGFSLDGRKSFIFEGDGGLKVQITAP